MAASCDRLAASHRVFNLLKHILLSQHRSTMEERQKPQLARSASYPSGLERAYDITVFVHYGP